MLEIIQIGNPVLRQKARPLTTEEILSTEIQDLIKEMRLTMEQAPGVGLAAPQIGKSIQLIVLADPEELQQKYFSQEELDEHDRHPVPFQVIINPTLKIISEKKAEFFEGCLSFENFVGIVPRALEVSVDCLDEHAQSKTINAQGWFARILQHEVDHLQGTICIDRMHTRSLTNTKAYREFWFDKKIADVKAALTIT